MNWLRLLLSRRRLYSDLSEEIRQHLEEKIDELVASGLSREEATHAAWCEFGNATLIEEQGREVWQWHSIETFLQDVRYGLRQLCRSPVFTTVAIMTLALAIGANTAIFSVINAVMLRMLPVPNPEELVQIASQGQRDNKPFVGQTLSYPLFKDLREHQQVFRDMAAVAPWSLTARLGEIGSDKAGATAAVVTAEPPNSVGEIVSADFFSVLGLNAVAGRFFAAGEDKGVHPVVVISYALWTRMFARDPRAIGRTLRLSGLPFTVIGVAPAHFSGLDPGQAYDLWMPISMEPQVNAGCECGFLTNPHDYWLNVIGRVKPGVSEALARTGLDVPFQQALREHEMANGSRQGRHNGFTEHITLLAAAHGTDYVRKEFSRPLFLLMGAVALVLLIACANIANLLLARASVRQKEIAVRLALGASRWRLVRQLLTESVLLAVTGGALGAVFAYWGSPLLVAMMALGGSPVTLDVHPDLRVLGFTLLVAIATGVVFGLAPAFRATRTGVGATFQTHSRTLTLSRPARSLGQVLTAGQLALSLVLVIGAALLVRTLRNLETFNAGFSRQGVLLFGIAPTRAGYRGGRLTQLYQQLQQSMSQLPGVRSVSFSFASPVSGGLWDGLISVEGDASRSREGTDIDMNSVGPEFFETLGIPLLAGRDFGPQDRSDSSPVAIINQAMARRFFAGRNPLGRRFGWNRGKGEKEVEVVAVVGNAKYLNLREEMPPTAYLPALQGEAGDMTFEVRTAASPMDTLPSICRLLRAFDSRLAPWDPRTLTEQVDQSLYQEKLLSTLSSFFGVLALVLACIGLYGTMAYAVTRRINEIGVRMALGAQRNQILQMVLREALLLTVIGVALGLPAAWAATRSIGSMLYGLNRTDPATTLAAILLMACVAVFAGYLPARRAARVDPIVALRHE